MAACGDKEDAKESKPSSSEKASKEEAIGMAWSNNLKDWEWRR